MPESSTTRYLAGKKWPGSTLTIAKVLKRGSQRTIVFEDGHTLKTDKARLTRAMYEVLTAEQKTKALRSIRVAPDGTAKATLGGSQKGERRTYKTKEGATRAVDRFYAYKPTS